MRRREPRHDRETGAPMAVDPGTDPLSRRMSGLLLHPTSLPGNGPIGTLGPAAEAFLDFLARARQQCWQMLPIGPTPADGSPYNGLSAFALNTWLIAHEPLVEAGWVTDGAAFAVGRGTDRIDHAAAARRSHALVERARTGFEANATEADHDDYAWFLAREDGWLDDYALFVALRQEHAQRSWTDWSPALIRREPEALAAARGALADAITHEVFAQYLVDRQWRALRQRAQDVGLAFIGDIPIYVAHDSAEVWANQRLFDLDERGHPNRVAGVPPDYFSETGQRWGNPLYRWDRMAAADYEWWIARFARLFTQFDLVRIDHFRGFEAFWSIPAAEATAVSGEWVAGPGEALFRAVEETLGGPLGVIAEDLGMITDEVRALRDRLGFPGMAIVQFAFDGDPHHPYRPENARVRQAIYPGTHDNDTTRGWYAKLSESERQRVDGYFGGPLDDPAWALIEACWRSPANLAVAQVQDVLSLGSDARFNVPGEPKGNWSWRQGDPGALEARAERLARLTDESERAAD